MQGEKERDLAADLALCERIPPFQASYAGLGVYSLAAEVPSGEQYPDGSPCPPVRYEIRCSSSLVEPDPERPYDRGSVANSLHARWIAEASEGWPEAIKRALAAEERVRELEEENRDRAAEARWSDAD